MLCAGDSQLGGASRSRRGRREDGLTATEREELRRPRRENRQLREEREIPKEAAVWFARETGTVPGEVFKLVKANQVAHAVVRMCRVLGVSPSGYSAWRSRGLCARLRRNKGLDEAIRTIHEDSRGTYGVPRVHAEPAARACQVSRRRVARLMREVGFAGVSRRRGRRYPSARS